MKVRIGQVELCFKVSHLQAMSVSHADASPTDTVGWVFVWLASHVLPYLSGSGSGSSSGLMLDIGLFRVHVKYGLDTSGYGSGMVSFWS